MDLKSVIEKNDTTLGKIFDLTIQSLILLNVFVFSLETLPEVKQEYPDAIFWFQRISLIIFTIEYVLRVIVADRKLSFIFSFYGLIDLIAILPTYLSLGLDLRGLRIFRMLRLLRILKLARYSQAMKNLKTALFSIKEELLVFLFVTIILLYIGAVGIYHFENPVQPEVYTSVFHSLWWSVATLTTVGYGDIYPVTIGGKIFTFFLLMIGMGIVAIPGGLIAGAFSKINQKK